MQRARRARSTAATPARRSACCAGCSPASGSRRRCSATSRCRKRPMRRVIEPLAKMGATITRRRAPASTSRRRSSIGPATRAAARARLRAADGVGAGQDRDAARRPATPTARPRVTEPGPSRDHSERMLAYLGAPLTVDRPRARRSTRAAGIAGSRGDGFEVPADPSSAGVPGRRRAASPAPARSGCRTSASNPTRTGFLDAIAAMGGTVTLEDRARRRARAGRRPRRARPGAATCAAPRSPATSRCARSTSCRSSPCSPRARRGTTIVRDAEELRVKESDRIATTCAMLRAFGVACEARPDGFIVEGRPDRPLDARPRPRRRRSPDRDGRPRSPALVASGETHHRRRRQRRDVVSRASPPR